MKEALKLKNDWRKGDSKAQKSIVYMLKLILPKKDIMKSVFYKEQIFLNISLYIGHSTALLEMILNIPNSNSKLTLIL